MDSNNLKTIALSVIGALCVSLAVVSFKDCECSYKQYEAGSIPEGFIASYSEYWERYSSYSAQNEFCLYDPNSNVCKLKNASLSDTFGIMMDMTKEYPELTYSTDQWRWYVKEPSQINKVRDMVNSGKSIAEAFSTVEWIEKPSVQ